MEFSFCEAGGSSSSAVKGEFFGFGLLLRMAL
jgi:hypothetical protein